MKLLDFFSFGTWNVIIKPEEVSFFLMVTCIFFFFLLIKLIVLVAMDYEECAGPLRYLGAFFIRIFQILLQASLLFLIVLPHNINLSILILVILCFYHIGLGIYFIADDYRGKYIYTINQNIVTYINTHFVGADNYFKNRKHINQTNKTIYEYRKNALIG